jgi:hypothetical protein
MMRRAGLCLPGALELTTYIPPLFGLWTGAGPLGVFCLCLDVEL